MFFSSEMAQQKNVYGAPLTPCCYDPMTGISDIYNGFQVVRSSCIIGVSRIKYEIFYF